MAGNSILLAALSVLSACQQSKRSEVGRCVCVTGSQRVWVCKRPGVCVLQGGGGFGFISVLVCVCVCVRVCVTVRGEGLGL